MENGVRSKVGCNSEALQFGLKNHLLFKTMMSV